MWIYACHRPPSTYARWPGATLEWQINAVGLIYILDKCHYLPPDRVWLKGQVIEGVKEGLKSGTSQGSNPACLCWSSAHLVQCEPDEPSRTWTHLIYTVSPTRMPDYAIQCYQCSLPSQSWGLFQPWVCYRSAQMLRPAQMPDGPPKKPRHKATAN